MPKTIIFILGACLMLSTTSCAWPWHRKEAQPSGEDRAAKKEAAAGEPGKKAGAKKGAAKKNAAPAREPARQAKPQLWQEAGQGAGASAPRISDGNAPRISYVDREGGYSKPLALLWGLNVSNPLKGLVWIGSASKEVPYGEQERRDLADALIQRELEVMRKEFASKKKGGEGGKDVKELLNQFLGDDKDKKDAGAAEAPKDGAGGEKKGEAAAAAKPAVEGFDEEDARKKILRRLAVPTSKIVEARAVYFQLGDGDLYCVDLATGITNWIVRLGGMLEGIPFETRDAIHFVMKGSLCAIEKQSGLLLHRSTLDQAVFPAPFASSSAVYVGTHRSRVMQWEPRGNFSMWSRLLSGEISSGITGNDEAILVPQEDGVLVCLGFDGKEKWSFINKGTAEDRVYYERELRKIIDEIHKEEAEAKKEEREKDQTKIRAWEARARDLERELDLLKQRVRGRFLCLPVTRGESVYIGSTDYNLYRVNRYTGLPEWQYVCKGQVLESPFVTAETVWQRDATGVLHGVAVKNGAGRARIPSVSRVLQATDEMVFFLEEDKPGVAVRTVAYGINRLEGVGGGVGCRVSPEGDILFAFDPNASVVHAFSLSAVRR